MRKNFGIKTWLYPMPVLILGTYDEMGNPNAMNAAWGGIYDTNQVMVCLSHDHKTTENIKKTGAFTLSFATASMVAACDYVGIVSANEEPDKFAKAGFHATKSEFVNAPLIDELPMALECKLIKFNEDDICIAQIINVSADEQILGEDGTINVKKLDPILYESIHHTYLRFGNAVGKAFSEGKKLSLPGDTPVQRPTRILTKEEFNTHLDNYYQQHYGRQEDDLWMEQPAVNVWVFKRGNRYISLKAHILTGEVEATVEVENK